jgi:hypothetical protein
LFFQAGDGGIAGFGIGNEAFGWAPAHKSVVGELTAPKPEHILSLIGPCSACHQPHS